MEIKRDWVQSHRRLTASSYMVKICAFPHKLGSPSSYITLHLIPSEFPYIWGKFFLLFYQWGVRTTLFTLLSDCSAVEEWESVTSMAKPPSSDVRTTLFTLLSDCSTVEEWKVWPAWQNHPHRTLGRHCSPFCLIVLLCRNGKVWPGWQNHPHHLLASMCLAGVPHRRREGDLATSVAICVYTVCTVQYTNTYKILQEHQSRSSFLIQNVMKLNPGISKARVPGVKHCLRTFPAVWSFLINSVIISNNHMIINYLTYNTVLMPCLRIMR